VVAAPWWTFAAALGCYGLGATLRIRAEERLLSARFGSQFDEYRRRVPALVPRCR
jgi:protein-S-isoprenylcysteine O-methyltransferase Ste14